MILVLFCVEYNKEVTTIKKIAGMISSKYVVFKLRQVLTWSNPIKMA